MRIARGHVVASTLLASAALFVACAVGDQSPDVVSAPVSPQSQASDSGIVLDDAAAPSTSNIPPASDDSGATPPSGSDDSGTPASDDSGTPVSDDSGTSSGTDSGPVSVVPTTCAKAYTTYGCCVGNEVYYCASGSSTITKKACSGGEVCGWNSSQKYYYCVASPGGSDPSGTHPMACQ